MRVLVTGGNGAVGTAIVTSLRDHGHYVDTLSSRRGDHRLDLCTAPIASLRRVTERYDAVVHAAGIATGNPVALDRVNVRGTSRLLQAVIGSVPRLLYISSTGRYGSVAGGVIDESSPPRPDSVYERTKALGEDQVLAAERLGVISAASVQPSVVLGLSRPSLISRLLDAAARGVLPGHAPGAVLNAVDSSAVGQACVRLLQGDERGTFILSQPVEWSLAYQLVETRVARRVRRLPTRATSWLGWIGDRSARVPMSGAGARALRSTTVFSSARARATIGFEPMPADQLISGELP